MKLADSDWEKWGWGQVRFSGRKSVHLYKGHERLLG